MEIEKIERLRSLFSQISDMSAIKMEMARTQNYEEAANARDTELKLIKEIDKIVGHDGYYDKIITLEKINYHIDNIKNSILSLKNLNRKIDTNNLVEINSEVLLSLQNEQIEIQNKILDIRKNVGLPEKNFDEKLAF